MINCVRYNDGCMSVPYVIQYCPVCYLNEAHCLHLCVLNRTEFY